ncbi:lamin tail domain-containing protein [Streptomyces sp. Caat 7-52]|uniref:lamin tail domain-containing protein n=1 Tax=Streptomyces sp. Caat 7-52 TaxID=2949637 RepID=UPI002035761A|nr:lamin tail domain-containing protein [Streptomyces sp. Caat 7-52]
MSVFVSASVIRRRVATAAAAVVAATAVAGAVAPSASAADRDHSRSDRSHHRDGSHRADSSQVVISGAQLPSTPRYDRSNAALNKEWVEVTNDSRRDVNLDGWTLSDEDGHPYTFRHYRLRAHQAVRVHTGFGRDRKNDLYQDRNRSVWDSEHDTATLRNDHGRFIDSASWGYDRSHRDGHGNRNHPDRSDHRDGGRPDRHR